LTLFRQIAKFKPIHDVLFIGLIHYHNVCIFDYEQYMGLRQKIIFWWSYVLYVWISNWILWW